MAIAFRVKANLHQPHYIRTSHLTAYYATS